MRNLKRKAFFFFFLFCFELLFTSTVYAEAELGLTPAKVELSLARGESVNGEITVINEGNEPLEVSFYVRDYRFTDDGKVVFTESQEERWSASKWLEIGRVSDYLLPGASVKLPYEIRVPLDAEPGSHWAVIFAEGRFRGSNTPTSNLSVRVGAVVLITVPGDIIAKGEILDFRIPPLGYRKIPFTFKFKNSGNIHINLRPQLEVFHKGRVISRLQMDEVVSYPQTEREVRGYLQLGNSWGLHEVVLKIEQQEVGTMAYRALFLSFPWPWFVAGLLLTFLIWLIIRRKRKQVIPKLAKYATSRELALEREVSSDCQAMGINSAHSLPVQQLAFRSRRRRADFANTLNTLVETVEQLRQENIMLRRKLEDISSQANNERWEKMVAKSLIDAQMEIENIRSKTEVNLEKVYREAHRQMIEIENRYKEKFRVLFNDYKSMLSEVNKFLNRLDNGEGRMPDESRYS